MATTPIYGLRYQALGDPPDGAALGANLAADVEAQVVRLDAAILSVAALTAAKTGNTTRNSTTTLTADPDLTVSAAANKVYRLNAFLIYTSGSTPDFKLDISGPASHVLEANVLTFNAAATAGAQAADQRMLSTGANLGIPGLGNAYSTQRQQISIDGTLVTAGTAGTVAIRWSQNTLDAGATVLYLGSWFRLEPMG